MNEAEDDDSLREDRPTVSSNGTGREPRTAGTVSTPLGRLPGETEDEQLLNRPVPRTPRPRAPELGAFTHSDPWRIMRIQAEFVHGFNALAEVGAAVAIFGSARIRADNPNYAAARELADKLARSGFAVITGGGPGIMEA